MNLKIWTKFWFTSTGNVKENENAESAAKREIKEETDLEVKEIFDLNWGSIYDWHNKTYEEKNFLCFVDSKNIKLDMVEVIESKCVETT